MCTYLHHRLWLALAMLTSLWAASGPAIQSNTLAVCMLHGAPYVRRTGKPVRSLWGRVSSRRQEEEGQVVASA